MKRGKCLKSKQHLNYTSIPSFKFIRQVIRKILNDGSNLFKNFEKEHNKKVWYIMTQEIINIDKKTICSKTIIFYDLKEKVLDSFTIPDYMMNWESIVPDTHGETLYNAITEKNLFYECCTNIKIQIINFLNLT